MNTKKFVSTHDKATMNKQRKILAIIGFVLPILSTIPGFIAGDRNAEDFWYSISASFYATTMIFMVSGLAIFSFFLFAYLGYDIGDRLTCCFSGAMSAGILIFPCKTSAAGLTTGIFNLPTPISHTIHCIVAALLFASFAYMIGLRFTRHDPVLVLTDGKRKRNNIYRVCAIIIALGMVSQCITSVLDIGWFTIINETVMLWAFSFAWGVKSHLFDKLFMGWLHD